MVAGTAVAVYLAVRLLVLFVRGRRRHVAWHVLWMSLALLVTSAFTCVRLLQDSGSNIPLTWVDLTRAAQVLLLIAGLRPLWLHHRSLAVRRSEQTT